MLNPGWDDDLKSFVSSWQANDWLKAFEAIRRKQWLNPKRTNLQRLMGQRLTELPSALSRDEIFDLMQSEHSDLFKAFLWVMAWGHSGTNYGAARVDEIVGDPGTEAKLSQIIGLARKGDIEAAFRGLHGEFRIWKLGTSFGSKLIYFAGFDPTSDATQPLILDQLVANALGVVLDPLSGETTAWVYETKKWDHYWAYCDLVRRMRDRYVPGSLKVNRHFQPELCQSSQAPACRLLSGREQDVPRNRSHGTHGHRQAEASSSRNRADWRSRRIGSRSEDLG